MKIHAARLMTRALLALALCLGGAPAVWAADLVVDTLEDADVNDDVCSLREAITAANRNENYNGCTGTGDYGDDTITFGVSGTIGLGSTLTIDGAGLTIDGTGQSVTVSGENAVRVMLVNGGAALRLEHLTVANGRAPTSGGLSGEIAEVSGGGIRNDGTLTVTHSTFSANTASLGGYGGGIFNDGTLTVTHSTLSGNSAALFGGGIANRRGTLTVTHSTFSANSTSAGGGGIANNPSRFLSITNSTFSGNSSRSGGGIRNDGSLTVTHSTFSGSNGGGIVNLGGALTLTNSIVANSTTRGDCDNIGGTLNSQGVNLVGDGSCGLPGGTAALGPLALNGGPTRTHALLPDSDAIDTADGEFCTETDQRGVSRPQPFPDGDCDIGAFELVQEASITIASVIELFDAAVLNRTLVGTGPGNSAAGRLKALRNMLLAAGDLIEQNEVGAACTQLQDVAERTDGLARPPDFVSGTAAAKLLDAVTELQQALGCFDK